MKLNTLLFTGILLALVIGALSIGYADTTDDLPTYNAQADPCPIALSPAPDRQVDGGNLGGVSTAAIPQRLGFDPILDIPKGYSQPALKHAVEVTWENESGLSGQVKPRGALPSS